MARVLPFLLLAPLAGTEARFLARTDVLPARVSSFVEQIVKPCEDACFKAGEPGDESSCFTMCESEMYTCHDHNHTVAVEEFKTCADEVVAKYEKYHAELLQRKNATHMLASRADAKLDKARQIVKPCDDACFKAGEAGDESSCFTMCESEMYKCHDHNHTVAVDEFKACHDEVVAKYEKYHAELLLASKNATQVFAATFDKQQQIVKPCEDACFKAGEAGDESSCFTMCEAEMYKCHDHNHTVAVDEFKACHDEVVAKYEKYHAELLLASKNATHTLAASFDKQQQIVKPCEDACFKAGEAGDESSCFTMCEAEMYKCHDHNHTVAVDEFKACHDEVVAKYEKYHAELLLASKNATHTFAATFDKQQQIVKPCEDACFKAGEAGDESSCFTMCEAEMYKCHDHNHTVAVDEFKACHDEVVAKYEKYHAELLLTSKNATTHMLTSRSAATSEDKRQIVEPCKGACFKAGEAGDESSCFTMCEAEMYKCHDHNHTVATAEFQSCHDEVVAKYEKYHAE
jgi:hypothetical protein